tara:strand:- start:4531 stop:5259 length:729 start_codon:yes stop_codon:yes gene_type:complete
MSTTTFADTDKEETPVAKTEIVGAEPKAEVSTEVADTQAGVDNEDVNISHIQLLSKSSQFEPEGSEVGDICFDKEFSIAAEGEPLKAIIVGTRKFWKENIPFGDTAPPRFANTLEEKLQIEATTEFKGTVPVCEVIVLIERPESLVDEDKVALAFLYEFGGKEYALVKYTVQKAQAVRENYGTINTVTNAGKTRGHDASKDFFLLRSKLKASGQYKWHQFVLSGTKEAAPEGAIKFAESLRG